MVRAARVAIVVLLVLTLAVGVTVAENRTGGTVVVEQGQTVNEDLTASGGTVIIRGTVNGDLQAFAGNVVITGTVDGDVNAFSGNVRIAGRVTNDVQAFGGNVFVDPGADIGGDLAAAGGVVQLDGAVGGDTRVGASEFSIGPNADLAGDVEWNAQSHQFDEGAQIGGTVRQVQEPVQGPVPVVPRIPGWVSAFYGFLVNLVFGLIVLALVPEFSREVGGTFRDQPLSSGGVGLLALVGVPVVLAIIAITIIGIPLALLGGLLYAIALWLGYVYGAYALGAWLLTFGERERSRWLALVLGLLVVTVVGLVPVVGGFVVFVVFLLGLGALSIGFWRRTTRRRPGSEAGEPGAGGPPGDEPPTGGEPTEAGEPTEGEPSTESTESTPVGEEAAGEESAPDESRREESDER